MSRVELDDRISYCKRELAELESLKTNCLSCDNKKYNRNECVKHGAIPGEYVLREDCPDWKFQSIPF